MKAWIVRDLEPLPIDPGNRRLMRAGMLSMALAESGHQTTWFTSNFDHYRKRLRPLPDGPVEAAENLTIHILGGTGYPSNISLQRVRHNRQFAAAFMAAAAKTADLPDVIITDIPTTEAAAAAIRFARSHGIVSVLSVRDLWPDTFRNYVNSLLRHFVPLLSLPQQYQARFACRNATSMVGISGDYLDWGIRKANRTKRDTDIVIPLSHSALCVTEEEIAAARAKWGLTADRQIVSFVGAWGGSVNLQWIADVARAHVHRRKVTFVIGGEGNDNLEKTLAALPNVVLTGWLDAHNLALLLSISDLGLLPYIQAAPQSVPNKVYDYMAYGVFQIGTLAGATGEIYEETGIGKVVAPSASALAEAVGHHLDHPAAKGREGIRKLFLERFDAGSIYERMVRHIERVVKLHQHG